MSNRRLYRLVAGLAVVSLALAACSGSSGQSGAPAGSQPPAATEGEGNGEQPGAGTTVNMAINPWVGYEANAAVIAEVAESELGCTVELKNLKEEVAWQGFATGEVDAVVENWGHEDLKQKYITDQKVAVEAGPTGNIGIIGWWVPPWMVEEYPDILDWQNLNKYADLFETSESGGKGQLLDGDPSFVTNDAALVENLDLDFQVVYAGSEAALITAFRQAEENRTPLLGYFYAPQWFLSEVDLQKVELPPYEEGCDADPEKVACDYPEYELDKIVSKEFSESGSPAYELVKNFQWTNDDQNIVAKYIAEDGMSSEEAATKWVSENQDKVDAWLP